MEGYCRQGQDSFRVVAPQTKKKKKKKKKLKKCYEQQTTKIMYYGVCFKSKCIRPMLQYDLTSSAGITRQAMYIYRNNKVCSCSHSCSGKAISITGIFSECVCVYVCVCGCVCVCVGVVLIQHGIGIHHIVICGLPHSTIFFHIIS